jgi:hypothetical protein
MLFYQSHFLPVQFIIMFPLSVSPITRVLLFIIYSHAFIFPRVPIPSGDISPNSAPAIELVDQALDALGGEPALRKIEGITYHAPR